MPVQHVHMAVQLCRCMVHGGLAHRRVTVQERAEARMSLVTRHHLSLRQGLYLNLELVFFGYASSQQAPSSPDSAPLERWVQAHLAFIFREAGI